MSSSDLGIFLRQARKAKAMTQLSVAELLNVSPQAVSKWERGECLPDIMLLPLIADILSISVEDILSAGNTKADKDISTEIHEILQSFVDNRLFSKIRQEVESAGCVADIKISPDIFLVLNSEQKDILLDILFELKDYEILLDEIFQYIGNTQRVKVIMHILDTEAYENLEPLIPFMTKSVRTEVIKSLLDKNKFEFLEDLLAFMSRDQKDLIVNKMVDEQIELDIVENFLPFFDINQRKRIQEMEEHYERRENEDIGVARRREN